MAFAQIMRKPWSLEEVVQLRKLVKQNTHPLKSLQESLVAR
jgi:hypothetical protein